jgi:hypothetical protein
MLFMGQDTEKPSATGKPAANLVLTVPKYYSSSRADQLLSVLVEPDENSYGPQFVAMQ